MHQPFAVNTWCWSTGFHPEKINKPHQTHSPLKMLINPHRRSGLHRNGKSHCPSFMFGEISVSNFFKASQGQITAADLKGQGWPCLWEKGMWPGPAASLNSLLHNTMCLLAQNPIYTSAFIFSPRVTMRPNPLVSN